jgi:hypothetical protein
MKTSRRRRAVVVAGIVALSSACFEPPCELSTEPGALAAPCPMPTANDAGRDAGVVRDAGAVDAGRLDAGLRDAGVDAGPGDAGSPDGGFDAGLVLVDAGVTVIDLGVVITPDGGAAELSFDVGPGAEGFQVELVRVSGPLHLSLQVDTLRNPAGAVLAAGPDYQLHRSRSRPHPDVQAALVLESDDARAEWAPGRWRFQVMARDDLERPVAGVGVHARVFVKPKPPPGFRQRLALNLFFSGSAGLTAATAPTQRRLQQGLGVFRDLYLDAGIELAPPRLFDLPPGFTAVTSYEEQDGGVRFGTSAQALWRQSANTPPGVCLFFVESISIDPRIPAGAILGIAGGVPGPTMTQGTTSSGVLVLFDAATYVPRRPGDTDPLPIALAHEVGHQLGLSHVYEVDGTLDNLSDTGMQGQRAADDNLMAPYANNLCQTTPLQQTTLRRNPVVTP